MNRSQRVGWLKTQCKLLAEHDGLVVVEGGSKREKILHEFGGMHHEPTEVTQFSTSRQKPGETKIFQK